MAEYLYEAARAEDKDGFDNTSRSRYLAAVERLTAESWFREYDEQERGD